MMMMLFRGGAAEGSLWYKMFNTSKLPPPLEVKGGITKCEQFVSLNTSIDHENHFTLII